MMKTNLVCTKQSSPHSDKKPYFKPYLWSREGFVSRRTIKIDHKLQHTKPMFFHLKLLTLFNLFTYFTGCIAMRLLKEQIPVDVYRRFSIASISCRLLYLNV